MRTRPAGILIFLLAAYAILFPSFERVRKEISRVELQELTLPPFVSRFLALEFRSIAADYIFVRVTQFYGGNALNIHENSTGAWLWLYSNLHIITDLDPYFEDPYYFGNAVLSWKAHMFNQANKLLQKGTDARTWDWQLPFFLGFNKFYFLNDNKSGADDILAAAKRPGAPSFLPTLASRLYNDAGKTEIAIALLTNFWENEKNEGLRNVYKTRIEALKQIQVLEKAVSGYKRRTGRFPENLQVLVRAKIIKDIPKDPYGGIFYLDKNGSVMTTSKLAFKPKQPREGQK